MEEDDFIWRGFGRSSNTWYNLPDKKPYFPYTYDEMGWWNIYFSHILDVVCEETGEHKDAVFVSATSAILKNDGTKEHIEGFIEIPDKIEVDDEGYVDFSFINDIYDISKHIKVKSWCYKAMTKEEALRPYCISFRYAFSKIFLGSS